MGTFDVQLIVEDGYGNVDTLLKEDYITVTATPPPPVANFTSDRDTVNASGIVYFTDLSTGNPTSWEWTFEGGDPGTSSLQAPPGIVYDIVGTFDVTLTVANANGDSTLAKFDYITVIPVANAGENDSVDEASEYTLNGENSFPQALSYSWESLDGMVLDDSTSPTPMFFTPNVEGDTDVRFVLTVNRDGQVSRPDTVVITILDYVGIETFSEKAVKVYPNPCSTSTTVEVLMGKEFSLTIINTQGQIMQTLFVHDRYVVNTYDYPKGLYFFVLQNASGKITKKVIVQ